MVLGFYRLHKLVSMLRKEGPNGEKIAVLLRELNGQGKWQPQDGQLQLNGTAFPRERASELEPLLKLLGPDVGNGRHALALAMRLSIQ